MTKSGTSKEMPSEENATLSTVEALLIDIRASLKEVEKLLCSNRYDDNASAKVLPESGLIRPQAIRSVRLPHFFYDDEVREYIMHAVQTRLVSVTMLHDEVKHLFGKERTPGRSTIGDYVKRADEYFSIYQKALPLGDAAPKKRPPPARKRRS